MQPTISAFYQCYKQPKAFLHALASFRQHYPDSTITLISDGGGYDYAKVATLYNCHYSCLAKRTGEFAESTVFSSRQDFLDWLSRLLLAAKNSTEDYILLLEDDVIVFKPIESALRYDINGANVKEFMGKKMEAYLKSIGKVAPLKNGRFYYGGCGGALFKRTFLLEHFSDSNAMEEIIKQYEPYREGRHLEIYSTDYWISLLTFHVGGTIGLYDGFCEKWQSNFWLRKNIFHNIEVLHQDKSFYNKALTVQESAILGELHV